MRASTSALIFRRAPARPRETWLLVIAAVAVAAVVLILSADFVLAQQPAPPAPSGRGAVTTLTDDQGTSFFSRPLGRRLSYLCTGLSIVGGVWAVINAARKGIFSRGGAGGGMGGGGGGVGQIFKYLIGPLVGCALLLNLGWTFSGINWIAEGGGDILDEIGNWWSGGGTPTTPTTPPTPAPPSGNVLTN